MKKQLIVYLIFIVLYIVYNQFFQLQDEKLNAIISILFTSFLFLYMGYVAFLVLKRMKKTPKK